MDIYYTSERNVQIVIALLKKNNIRKIIASPGTTNITFIASVQHDSFFQLYSVTDERSAAYIACGMAAELNEPVVLSCTGATASRNYLSGMTEAFYRKLPVLAITSTQHTGKIGTYEPQVIDRSVVARDVCQISVNLPLIHCKEDENDCIIKANQAILALFRHGGGPAHINLTTGYSSDFSCKEIPAVRSIERIFPDNQIWPKIMVKKVVVFVGSHCQWDTTTVIALEKFCEKYNAFVFCDHTSNYFGKYRLLFSLAASQPRSVVTKFIPELIIHLGTVSGDYSFNHMKSEIPVWRVNLDGEIRDLFNQTSVVFEMSEKSFFEHYNLCEQSVEKSNSLEYYKECQAYQNDLTKKIPELPFSNPWIASQLIYELPVHSILHLGILNSLRSWNFFDCPNKIRGYCNTGGFGIDGCLSSAIGASFVNQNSLVFCVLGDLAFFYDMNSLANRHVGKNLRILLINNGCGTEFKNYMHMAYQFGDYANPYMAGAGHFGRQSRNLVKHYVQDLGFEYISAASKEEFELEYKKFINPEISNTIVWEIFTQSKDESDALMALQNIDCSMEENKNNLLIRSLKKIARKVLSEDNQNTIRSLIYKKY